MIEVGEYVRLKTGRIFKITAYDPEQNKYHSIENLVWNIIFPEDIIKHSKNIIDLIEVGDYVNGEKVIEVDSFKDWIDIGDEILREYKVKSIVTKEQFANIEYRLEENK